MDLLKAFKQGSRTFESAVSWLLTSDIRPSAGLVSSRRLLLFGFYRAALNRNRLAFIVTTEDEAIEALKRNGPGLLVVTPHLEQGDGLALLNKARAIVSDIRTIVVCDQTHDDLLAAGRSNADAVVCEQEFLTGAQPFRAMVIALSLGRRYRSAAIQAALETAASDTDPGWRAQAPELSCREQELVDLWVEGLGDREVSERLGVSYATVRSYGRTVRRKLGVGTRGQAVLKVVKLGLTGAARKPRG